MALRISLALLVIGCYSGRPTRPQGGSGDQYLLLASELEATKQSNIYDAVRQLRPFWFTRHARNRSGEAAIAVYLDGQMIGALSQLRRLPTYVAARVRYMSPTEAQVRFGSINGLRAAILVDSEKP